MADDLLACGNPLGTRETGCIFENRVVFHKERLLTQLILGIQQETRRGTRAYREEGPMSPGNYPYRDHLIRPFAFFFVSGILWPSLPRGPVSDAMLSMLFAYWAAIWFRLAVREAAGTFAVKGAQIQVERVDA